MFRRRVGGVYFAIITQAFAAIMTILIIGQQGYTGGINGITDLRTLLGWDIRSERPRKSSTSSMRSFCSAHCSRAIRASRSSAACSSRCATRKTACGSRAIAWPASRSSSFVAATLSGIGGAMFTLQFGFMSPTFVGIVPSIEMVIFAAVGGRLSILGAVYGALLVNWAKTALLRSLPGALALRYGRRCSSPWSWPSPTGSPASMQAMSHRYFLAYGRGQRVPAAHRVRCRACAFRCQIGGLR